MTGPASTDPRLAPPSGRGLDGAAEGGHRLRGTDSVRRMGLIERYIDRLPFAPSDPIVSLNEGSTPLIHAPRLSERVGADVYLKYEGLNPTGSFKDRGMTCAVSAAVREGAEAVICASTGNTAAALAAYAARAGIRGVVLVPDGKIAAGKLAQALMHGAEVIALRGNFDEALQLVRQIADAHPIALVNSVNDFRIEGQKCAAFEIQEDLEGQLDALCIPVGNAGNITAYWKGFRELHAEDPSVSLPRMIGFQARGANPLVRGEMVANPETVASAIRIGNPARWEEAMTAMTGSGGSVSDVTDEEILDAYRFLAREEGVFCEPASATSVAGLLKHGAGIEPGSDRQRIVCVLTGHGLKDPQTAMDESTPVIPCEPSLQALEKVLIR
ncbi:MAG: threonine synthase [Patulibacter sp.]